MLSLEIQALLGIHKAIWQRPEMDLGVEGKIIHTTINKKTNLTTRRLNAGRKGPGWLSGCGGSGGSKVEAEVGYSGSDRIADKENSGSNKWPELQQDKDSWKAEKLFQNFMLKNFDFVE